MRKSKIVLASASPRRKELLAITGLRFIVDPGDYEESLPPRARPHTLARFLSRKKAESVAGRHPKAIIIAADTFIEFRGRFMGKPQDGEHALRMLRQLNGKTHSVITGFTVLEPSKGKKISKSVETQVTFRKLAQDELVAYVASGEPLDKAGAYAIQGLGSLLVKKIEGDYFNVIGLPLSELSAVLKKFGVRFL